MGIKGSPEDTMAAATMIAGYVVAYRPSELGVPSWEIGYPQMAKRCIELGSEIAKARQDKEMA